MLSRSPSLKAFTDLPMERASSGKRLGPKRRRATTRMRANSGQPISNIRALYLIRERLLEKKRQADPGLLEALIGYGLHSILILRVQIPAAVASVLLLFP